MNFWPLETWRKKLEKKSPWKILIFFFGPENPLANHCYQMLFGEKKISFKESLYGKKNHHRESEFQMWKMTMADAMKKILNNQVLNFFLMEKKQCFQIWSIVHPNLCPARFFFQPLWGLRRSKLGEKTIAFFRQATPAPVGHFQGSNFRAQKSPPHFGQLQTCWPLIGWQL